MAKQITLHDVAAAVGVSAQTVSRVVNNKADVAEATRARVWRVVRQLGYKPNSVARSLVSQRTHTIGVLSLPATDHFLAGVLTGLEQEARARGYACILSFVEYNTDSLNLVVDGMLERQVDGVAMLVPKLTNEEIVPFLVPVVSLAHPVRGVSAINVDVNNIDGAYQATCHLIQLGHRCIGIIAGPRLWKSAEDRLQGARRAMAEAHLPLEACWIETCEEWTLECGYKAAQRLTARCPELTAFFCHNDWLAVGAARALREQGRQVPHDFSIMGYDDLPICQFVEPPLTSVRQPRRALGQLLAQLLINAIEYQSASQDMLVPPELVVRSSTAALVAAAQLPPQHQQNDLRP
jgi:DNA-binding LacI/PurR family transcriptional regulator